MTIWLFIGIVFVAMLAIWLAWSLCRIARAPDLSPDPDERRRRADLIAADAARQADARMPPYQGGYPV